MSISEAAERLNITTEAVRKRLQRGALVGEKVNGVWLVYLDIDQDRSRTQQDNRPDTAQDATRTRPDEEHQAVITELMAARAEVAAAERREAWLEARVEALETSLALERDARIEERRRTDSLFLAAMPRLENSQARPWWRRLWGK